MVPWCPRLGLDSKSAGRSFIPCRREWNLDAVDRSSGVSNSRWMWWMVEAAIVCLRPWPELLFVSMDTNCPMNRVNTDPFLSLDGETWSSQISDSSLSFDTFRWRSAFDSLPWWWFVNCDTSNWINWSELSRFVTRFAGSLDWNGDIWTACFLSQDLILLVLFLLSLWFWYRGLPPENNK